MFCMLWWKVPFFFNVPHWNKAIQKSLVFLLISKVLLKTIQAQMFVVSILKPDILLSEWIKAELLYSSLFWLNMLMSSHHLSLSLVEFLSFPISNQWLCLWKFACTESVCRTSRVLASLRHWQRGGHSFGLFPWTHAHGSHAPHRCG